MRFLKYIVIAINFLSAFCQEDINPNGYNKIYYPNGSLQSEGYLKNGKPEGYWKTYYSTGIIKSEGNRKNHLLDSVWIFYNSLGDTVSKINYVVGKKNGFFYTYYTNRDNPEYVGTIIRKELFVNDVKQGTSFEYYSDGGVKEIINYKNNKPDGINIEYADDGRIITIKRYSKGSLLEREKINRFDKYNQKIGVWKSFYESTKVKTEANYKNGLLNGYYKEYLQNGSLQITLLYKDGKLMEEINEEDINVSVVEEKYEDGSVKRSGPYRNEIPVGIHKEYSKEGDIINSYIYDDFGNKISQGIIDKEGNKNGDWIDFYTDGNVKAKGKYVNNKRDGKWIFYFNNQKVEQEGEYINGRLNGVWKWYYTNGSLWREEEYYNGKEEGLFLEYDINGELIVEGECFDGEKEGLWTTKIGDHIEKGKYVTGLRDGRWKYYYNDGTLKFEGDYIQGNLDGKHKYFYPSGVLKEEQTYTMGIKNKHWKKYDEFGKLIVTISYQDDKEYRINGVRIEFPIEQATIIN